MQNGTRRGRFDLVRLGIRSDGDVAALADGVATGALCAARCVVVQFAPEQAKAGARAFQELLDSGCRAHGAETQLVASLGAYRAACQA